MDSRENHIFKEKEKAYKKQFEKSNQKLRLLSLFRIIIFLSYFIIAVYSANAGNGIAIFISSLAFIIIFGFAVRFYNSTKYQTDHYLFLAQINAEEIMRLEGKILNFDQGIEYLNRDHPYTIDLDIFGKNSLFQLLNRATTYWGRNTLAKWFLKLESAGIISARQKSVKELSMDSGWMQNFQATGRHFHNKKDISIFLKWLKSKNLLLDKPILNIIRIIFPIISTVLLLGVVFNELNFMFFLLSLLINSLILSTVLAKVSLIHKQTGNGLVSLQAIEALILQIEKRNFKDPGLNKIKNVFKNDREQASRKIGTLKKILEQLDNRSNIVYHILNIGLLLDIHFTLAAERWKSTNSGNIAAWFENLGIMESLVSFAGFAYANPTYCFPNLKDDPYNIESKNMGHPLIPPGNRINNNFKIEGKGSIAMITGSNMAGKSTFLRTLGINQILALSGSKVCAEEMTCGPVQVYTSMRTQDNLGENISSFYAELKRIQQLIQFTHQDTPILFLLDEILKGTNSKDRHLGAVSLVNQLAKKTAFGLISTHDISLAKEAMKSNHVTNYSFNSTIEGDEIFFDYLLTPGICESFNASKLMEKIGIELSGDKGA